MQGVGWRTEGGCNNNKKNNNNNLLTLGNYMEILQNEWVLQINECKPPVNNHKV